MKVSEAIDRCYKASSTAHFSYATVQGMYEIIDRTLIVTFRATDSNADWARHFECGLSAPLPPPGARIHIGWLADYLRAWSAFLSIDPELKSKIDNAIFIGHSYGGALASIGAYFFAEDWQLPVSLVTFNAPRAGNRAFARELGKRAESYHFVYGADVICQVPPWYGRYQGLVHVAPRPFFEAAIDSVRITMVWAAATLMRKPINLFDSVVAKDHLLESFGPIADQNIEV